ncbi:(2Fe-2S)-binding protein [Mycolicibacterium goodii]|uniref:(2Fe-2S)-binding protein n=1 Tax=Mycolicibacterium goodii TaxID=134601 RepID=A0ABS6HLR9_MYCGD|nr:(2Fe-2S)-binding protein [Mycolicibacterium goodii]MBU8809786.1 (2Fe-2S)-binding protein [Mycolicibacterium goodii]MBU8817465.1 (2Fe-2S)-binding protein [Mycolicibacterium goodii]MBU8822624.1 (2Fe-2S)-binding protein [Mycolicibacterium goodii]MBU8835103.1 (2Fe-2S)-binding protein [Mycolicibacterium goodii]PJK21598.1 4-hydroxybenzoyl-CoA reductase subunit gamma [Mycolicibacterium goodii]
MQAVESSDRPAGVAVSVVVNGRAVQRTVPPRLTLADFLRDELRLTGTHLGCEHGVCGACTVFIDGRSARACLMLAVQADGMRVTTVEGLDEFEETRRLRQAFSERGGLQCGFCTPGFLVAAVELLRDPDTEKPLTEDSVREALSGNICRCTGYQGIVQAVLDAADG